MALPKVLLGVPLLIAGMYLPAGHQLAARPAGAVGMVHEGFNRTVVTIHRGQTVTFENDSRFIHIIGPGSGGHLARPRNEPINGRELMEQDQTYTTGRWNTPGTYSITCSVHPEMTTKIVVLP